MILAVVFLIHNTQKGQTFLQPLGIEPTMISMRREVDRPATGKGKVSQILIEIAR